MMIKNTVGALLALAMIAGAGAVAAKDEQKLNNPLASGGKPVAEKNQQKNQRAQQPPRGAAAATQARGQAKPKGKLRKTCRDRQGNKVEC